jgi:uncharacterized protein (DUF1810 family)
MWFIFAQLRALGRSPTANFYGIGSIEEARAYLRHPVLADRLALAVNAVLGYLTVPPKRFSARPTI